MNVYFISGLGADHRAFERIQLSDQYKIHHLHWIKPLPNEPLEAYAKRLASPINTSLPFALVGLSMGGMMAAALTKFLHPQLTILISSAGSATELPAYFKWCGRLRLHHLLPPSILDKPNGIAYRLFGAKADKERQLMKLIIESSDGAFIKWGIGAIITWREQVKPAVYHIHGTHDKILPIRNIRANAVVDKGSHFMVYTRAAEVSRLIEEALRQSENTTQNQNSNT